jgi:YesN/AraC family two-component response regulator
LKKYGHDGNYNWYFSLDRQGNPLVEPYNIFSYTFATMAFGQLSLATGNEEYAEIAKKTFDIILSKVDNPKGHWNKLHAGTRDLKNFALPMILCNLALEIEHLLDEDIVLEAADGKEGLTVAMKEVPDLVICDVMMPVMDGLEFTEQLKTNTATSHIPVIMLTAKNLEEHRAEGYEHGADSYITKPFHSKVLLARIENLLRQRQLLKHLYQGAQEAEKEISESHLEDRDKQFLKQLQAIIQKNLSYSEFGVEDMGQQIGLSRVQLYRKVKAMTGSSVVDLLRKARLAKARRLLETRSMSVSEVAYEVGFSAPSYFTKCFKDEYGMLPGDVTNG